MLRLNHESSIVRHMYVSAFQEFLNLPEPAGIKTTLEKEVETWLKYEVITQEEADDILKIASGQDQNFTKVAMVPFVTGVRLQFPSHRNVSDRAGTIELESRFGSDTLSIRQGNTDFVKEMVAEVYC